MYSIVVLLIHTVLSALIMNIPLYTIMIMIMNNNRYVRFKKIIDQTDKIPRKVRFF